MSVSGSIMPRTVRWMSAGSRSSSAQCRSSTSSLWATSSDVRSEEVAGVGVPGDQTEGLLLATTADQDPWPWAADRLRRADRLGQVVVAHPRRGRRRRSTSDGRSGGSPPAVRTARTPGGTERLAEVLPFVPGGADAELGPAARHHVQGGDDLGQQSGVSVGDAGDHQAERSSARSGRPGSPSAVYPSSIGSRRSANSSIWK